MLFSDILTEYTPYKNVLKNLSKKKSCVEINGVTDSAYGQLLYQLNEDTGRGMLVVCYSDMEAQNLYRDISFYTDKVCFFPNK